MCSNSKRKGFILWAMNTLNKSSYSSPDRLVHAVEVYVFCMSAWVRVKAQYRSRFLKHTHTLARTQMHTMLLCPCLSILFDTSWHVHLNRQHEDTQAPRLPYIVLNSPSDMYWFSRCCVFQFVCVWTLLSFKWSLGDMLIRDLYVRSCTATDKHGKLSYYSVPPHWWGTH